MNPIAHSQPDLILHSGQQHPALARLRLALRQAMAEAGHLPAWTETYAENPAEPPTLLADGHRLFRVTDPALVPSVETLRHLINKPTHSGWRQRLTRVGQLSLRFLSALFIAFFPKCPFCWAAYMSYLGATGVVSIPYRPWLIWVLVGLLSVNVVVLYQTRHRHGPGPFYLCLVGAALVVSNRLYWHQPILVWLGVGILLIGSLWNSLSPKMADSLQYFAKKIHQRSLRTA